MTINNMNFFKSKSKKNSNISLILSKFGYKVDSFEPDPEHFKYQKQILKKNNYKNIKFFNKAVYDFSGSKFSPQIFFQSIVVSDLSKIRNQQFFSRIVPLFNDNTDGADEAGRLPTTRRSHCEENLQQSWQDQSGSNGSTKQ